MKQPKAVLLSVAAMMLALPAAAQASNINGDTLPVPASGKINVAFVITDQTNIEDVAGPWEVFQDVMVSPDGRAYRSSRGFPAGMDQERLPFNLYTVSNKKAPVRLTGGMMLLPNYTFANAPVPQLVVVPAQSGNPEARQWIKKMSAKTDVTMSVCTGVRQLVAAGLLDGKQATTHHWFIDDFQRRFPNVHFQSGVRFVQNEKVSTAAGLTSGVDLALHVVERYFGCNIAEATADFMEYNNSQWKDPQAWIRVPSAVASVSH